MIKTKLLYCFFVAVIFSSCKEENTEIFLRNVSLSKGFQEAERTNKGLLLLSDKLGCSMCELFETDLMRDKEYAKKVFKNFVVLRVDENAIGGKWLSRILNYGGYPIFLFFDSKRELLGIEVGGTSKGEMRNLLAKIDKKQTWVDEYYEPGRIKGVSKERLLAYTKNSIEAHYEWEKFILNKNPFHLNRMHALLLKSISVYPSFFNNYMMAKCYAAKKQTDQSKQHALAALQVDNPVSLYLNPDLRTEMKMVLDSSYTVYNDAYMGIKDIQQNLGTLKFGERKTAFFTIKNIGKKDLVFHKLQTDCNCTVVSYPKSPINPGKTGIINVSFSAERSGEFSHMVFVSGNASNAPMELLIKGMVLGD